MQKKKFRITWADPGSGELLSVEKEFEGDSDYPPEGWARDYGYARADKGYYRIEEIS